MHDVEMIRTLAGGLFAALVMGYLAIRMGLSPIVGYLLAGIIVGPYTPGFTADPQFAREAAEMGVVLLMFGVGMHFHLDELLAVKRIAIPGALFQSLVATGLGAVAGWLFGWGWSAGMVFGLALSVASTVVLTRVLSDSHSLHTPTGHIAIGWLVVEDLFTVVVLVLMPAFFETPPAGTEATPLAIELLWASGKIIALVFIIFVLGGRVVPWLLELVSRTKSRELFTLTVLAVALGFAYLSVHYFEVSMALGAFLAGMIVGRSEYSLRAATDALPMRDAFAVLFFVSVGMLFDPSLLIREPGTILITLAVVLIGKPLAALLIVLLLGHPVKVALGVAIALAQIGEFSFILAALGTELHVLPESAAGTLIAVGILSISLNPILYQLIPRIERILRKQEKLWRLLNARVRQPDLPGNAATHGSSDDPLSENYRAVVIGYGPVGRTVTRLLQENGIQPTIVEMNVDTVRQLQQDGIAAIYGDANQAATLEQAGVRYAGSLIISASGVGHAQEIVRIARELNPDVRVLARSAYLRELNVLHQAGADQVFAGESEVALALTEAILRDLGATAEQIDRERDRVRTDLLGHIYPAEPAKPVVAPVPTDETSTTRP
ncbi:cation:proton antiporter [Tuwongella immobilis]|uniref:RCK N-terminal domain-containing protein n=1 Tax=Tuwongella immobilis TaxID=692036 RepID=A0A6C2YVK1_9BACT|nr:cation:proton antiporter [Tuwongella immobilis]VIP05009.1 sodium hydrogen exchanger : Monovalent cation/proton antiporter family protein OS=Geobacter sulfurreducens (strain ATCC 51573 / DSM 12127 / PCA) GN=GSU0261 PE=4 SV=1: Na_H_Exchanger: TrkA_N [Tuwongella immobilis]VTS07376.1 sodium hydrogen exchanger : Monovalent cation/proton antiporter family protein OS=Geobacter sulfurreducens (strain ATCC 51573 / DSM 12127 / PCA) GN=GSU0261 PE=4 SV=1: Na_H_Exchanger: TrkA_N [Tuwongella immobilis]